MNRKIIAPVVLMLLLAFLTAPAPAAEPVTGEVLVLHTDRRMYVSGETIWFSIFVTGSEQGQKPAGSLAAYVELINPWNRPVVQARFGLSGGRGSGDLLIPDTLSSGTYLLRAYTGYMENYLPVNCFIREIEIYNPFAADEYLRASLPEKLNGGIQEILNSGAEITADSVNGRRKTVTVKIKTHVSNPAKPSSLSISVVPAGTSALPPAYAIQTDRGNSAGNYKFESTGYYLSGSVRYRDSGPVDSSRFLYASVRGKTAEFYHARISPEGRFDLLLPADSRERILIIQPGNAGSNVVLEIDPAFPDLLPQLNYMRDTLNDKERNVFSELSFNFQAGKIYGIPTYKDNPAHPDNSTNKRRFYGIPEMEVSLDDYISLPVMQEVFFELLPGIILRNMDSGYELNITNPLTGRYYEEPPLVMIDGVIINDLNILAGFDPEKVEKIEVVMTPYLTGDLILHGIVNVITREGDFGDVIMQDYAAILPYRAVEEPKVFVHPGISEPAGSSDRIPDLRNTLFWDPALKTDGRGEAEVVFRTSDQPGLYELSVWGVSEEGEWIWAKEVFRVE
ncbi:MAG: hypothetical protein JXR67_10730 [Bacteroidales bacterium]|nr:hypothetical protein [Bacteroidales bacterium]